MTRAALRSPLLRAARLLEESARAAPRVRDRRIVAARELRDAATKGIRA